jgi:starch synthase (maltosyl-transferring)
MAAETPKRVVIENLSPAVVGGRSPTVRRVGDRVVVEADIFGDGHDLLRAVVLYHRPQMTRAHHEKGFWHEVEMRHLDGVRWTGSFDLDRAGTWKYTIEAWTDVFGTWRHQLARKVENGELDLGREMSEGIVLLREGADIAEDEGDRALIERVLIALADPALPDIAKLDLALRPELVAAAERVLPRHGSVVLERPLLIEVTSL